MKALLITFLAGFTLSLNAQHQISGTVTDKSKAPLLGVNVYLEGTYDGATTDIDGLFSFETFEEDSLSLIASFIGFHDATLPITGKSESFTIILKENINELNAVVISAGSFDASDEQKRVVLKPLDIVTTAGATADIPGALNTLPGTQTVGETGRLFVRGGEGRETKTFIDGQLVHNEYSSSAPNTPGRSRFSPFMFKGMSFSTGGYSAEYGQALSSALILQSKDLADNNRTDISLMTVGGDLSATRSFKNSSVAAKLQYTNLTPYFQLAPQNLEWENAPQDVNTNVAYRIKTSETGILKFYTNLSTSNMDLYQSDIANPEVKLPVKVSNDFAYFNASYKELVSDKLGIRTGASYTRTHDFASMDQNGRDQHLQGFHTKLVADYQQSDRLAVLVGTEVLHRDMDQTLSSEAAPINQGFNETVSAAFIESQMFASSKLAFKTGLRLEHNDLYNSTNVAPRISSAYKTGEYSQISVAYGLFHQAPSDQALLTQADAQAERAHHFIANYQWIKEGRSFRIESYSKQYNQLTRYTNLFDPTSYQYDGDGFANGIDVFWRDTKTINQLDYWISYSYLDTERQYQDFPGTFTPSFASAHNFSLVTKKFIEEIKSQVGITYSFASGRPYNDLNTDEFLSGKTPSYHDLSFNISYLLNSQVILHGMVNNALGINNIFGYDFASEPDGNGVYASRAIIPPAKRFIFLGVFITLSKNKGINQLPNL